MWWLIGLDLIERECLKRVRDRVGVAFSSDGWLDGALMIWNGGVTFDRQRAYFLKLAKEPEFEGRVTCWCLVRECLKRMRG
jgi:hypothetical protein